MVVYRLFRPVWIPGQARNDVGLWNTCWAMAPTNRSSRNGVGLWAGSMLLLLLRRAYAPSLSLYRPTGLKQSKSHSGMSHNKLRTRATILTPPLPHLIHIPFTSRLVPARQTGT